MQTPLDNWAYVERTNWEITKLNEELHTAKIDYFLAVKDGNQAQVNKLKK